MSDDCRYCFSDNWYYTLDFSVLWLRPRCFRFRSINLRLIIHFYFIFSLSKPNPRIHFSQPQPRNTSQSSFQSTNGRILCIYFNENFILIKYRQYIVSDFWWWWGREGSWDGEAGGVVWRHVGAFWILNKCQKRNFNPIKIQNMSCGFETSQL